MYGDEVLLRLIRTTALLLVVLQGLFFGCSKSCTAKCILGDPGAVSRFQVRTEEPLGTLSYKTSSKRSQSFWHLIGARKSLCFSAQSEWSVLSSPFVCFNTEMYKKLSCTPCLFGPCDEVLLECKRNRLDCPRKSYQKLYWILLQVSQENLFKSLRSSYKT